MMMKKYFLFFLTFFSPFLWATLEKTSAPIIEESLPFSENRTLYQLQVQGIQNKNAKENAETYAKLLAPESLDGTPRNLQAIRQSIEKAVSVYGYFSPSIQFDTKPPKDGKGKPLLIATVDQGEPTLIADTQIRFQGEAREDEAFKDLKKTLPKKGSQLNQKDYDNFKDDIRQLALERGYFDGEFVRALLNVRPSTRQGWWTLDYQSGERYRFGKITFEGNQIREDYLKNLMKMHEGEPYEMDKITEFSNDLSSTGWFSASTFQPQINKATKEMDLNIAFYPRKKNVFKVGVGYVSDEGPRLQLGWNKPWVNSRGHSLQSDFYISKPKITLEAAYRMPLKRNPLKYYYEATLGVEQEKDNDTESKATTAGIIRYWDRETGWQNALGLKVRYDAFTQADDEHHTLLVYPMVSAIRTRFKGGLFPYWGDTQRVTLEVGNKIFASDVDFYKIQASTIWIRQPWDNHRFITRAEGGYVKTEAFNKIPPALRFFIGGDRTVRGYGYKKISPKNEEGQLVGGALMANASLEYNYQVYPSWWLASFYDTGFVSEVDDLKAAKLHHSVGVGFRWVSPVGPVKLDLATPVHDPEGKHNVQVYLGLGSEL